MHFIQLTVCFQMSGLSEATFKLSVFCLVEIQKNLSSGKKITLHLQFIILEDINFVSNSKILS